MPGFVSEAVGAANGISSTFDATSQLAAIPEGNDEGPRGLTALRQKMAAYQRNGARLGWLLIPAERAVEIWEPLADSPAQPRRIEAACRLDGDPHFPGLAVKLAEIWAG